MKLDEIGMLTAEDFEGEDRYQWPRPGKVILEANYRNPSFSGPVTDKINAGGAQYVPGTKWILYQALTGYLSLTGRIPDLNAMEQVIADSQAVYGSQVGRPNISKQILNNINKNY